MKNDNKKKKKKGKNITMKIDARKKTSLIPPAPLEAMDYLHENASSGGEEAYIKVSSGSGKGKGKGNGDRSSQNSPARSNRFRGPAPTLYSKWRLLREDISSHLGCSRRYILQDTPVQLSP
jgi:hypothetical protein